MSDLKRSAKNMKSLTVFLILIFLPCLNAQSAEQIPSRIAVQGQIKSPGWLPIDGEVSLSEVIEKCGGLNIVWGGKVSITRRESDILTITRTYNISVLKKEERKKFLEELMVQPGDIVFFPEIVC
jgi:protein involved in polysaccharide export with SLBB domain